MCFLPAVHKLTCAVGRVKKKKREQKKERGKKEEEERDSRISKPLPHFDSPPSLTTFSLFFPSVPFIHSSLLLTHSSHFFVFNILIISILSIANRFMCCSEDRI